MNQKNQAASEGWPEDRADWPQTASVVQGGVVPTKQDRVYGKTQQETAADAITKVKGGEK